MRRLPVSVATKYGDYKGEMSIDMQDIAIEKIKDVKLPEGVLVGMGFEFGEMRGDCLLKDVTLVFLIADPEYGNTMQDVSECLPESNAKVQEVRHRIPVAQLGLFIKRFSCCGLYKELL
ncbi:hypothetical protein [Bacteroides heparinolyticus]|uniref:hypothetical protein n=1 Tax=Prevotella heparinolytica TaxID=28113 RepID=UPI00359FE997